MPRSGSSWLSDTLNKPSEGLRNYYEIICNAKEPFINGLIDIDEFSLYGPIVKKVIIERIKDNDFYHLNGFKFERANIQDDTIGFLSHSRKLVDKTIILKRNNPIDWALSQHYSLLLNQKNIPVNRRILDDDAQYDFSHNFSLETFEYYLNLHSYEINFLNYCYNFFEDTLFINYEDLFYDNKSSTCKMIIDYLSLPTEFKFETDLIQVRKNNSIENIANLSELINFLKKSKFQSFLSKSLLGFLS